MMLRNVLQGWCVLALLAACSSAPAQRLETPRRHDRPPGPPLSAEEAVTKMTVPEGFTVEVVAAEPDIVNPVAMCIDEQGRFWITESLEYPRKEPGPGRDRVKVLEDTNGDGRVDKTTIFAEGLNIPSGIAVGYGGVWVANSPDLLFMQDTDGDLKADKIETVVTGFGRTDTHELPNSLTWGPDGWLYGLNGVFNYSEVKYAKENPNYNPDHPGFKFTCAMWRVHPRTREFQVFAQGTSNPWGIAINEDGEFFISACVIDHLWHIVETGYYIRQGGPYPPHTWPMGSIVKHKHQKAAYCGITWFDSDAYPEEYRGVLYMGNIHGGCINADIAERLGSTYKAKPHPGFPAKPNAWKDDEYGLIRKTGDPEHPKLADFLTANDAWFMPVVQKVGPDGCLYILDWYDRYHCYQDANADPAGIDRAKGRLYRVRYKDTPHAQPFDLATSSQEDLLERLDGGNNYDRKMARMLLAERLANHVSRDLENILFDRVQDKNRGLSSRLRALWTLACSDESLDGDRLVNMVPDDHPLIRAWKTRLLGNLLWDEHFDNLAREPLKSKLHSRKEDDLRVLAQQAIVVGKLHETATDAGDSSPHPENGSGVSDFVNILRRGGDDPVLHQVVWQNLKPLLGSDPTPLTRLPDDAIAALAPLLARSIAYLSDRKQVDGATIAEIVRRVIQNPELSDAIKMDCTKALAAAIQQNRLSTDQLRPMRESLPDDLRQLKGFADPGLRERVLILRFLLGDSTAHADVRKLFQDRAASPQSRLEALHALIEDDDSDVLLSVEQMLTSRTTPKAFRSSVLNALARINDPQVADILLTHWDVLEQDVRPKALEILTQRPAWSVALLTAIDAKQINKDALNLNQITRVASFKDEEVRALVAKVYGQVRTGRRGNQQHTINRMRDFLHGTPGDPVRGQEAFKKVCGQCHKIYGEGAEVGPDITRNGRNDWRQLLTNVFDPSAVIGPGYQARILVTTEGRVLTGLAVEENDQRVVLKIQGGKIETIPRDQIDAYKVSEISMMPEELEKQLKPQELADLFSFLALDKPPSDPTGTYLPGAPRRDP